MPLVPIVQVVGGVLTSGVGVVSTVATLGLCKKTKKWARRGTGMICKGGKDGKKQVIGLSRAGRALLKIAIRGRSEEAAVKLAEGMENAELGLDGTNTTMIEHIPGAGVVVGGVHMLTGHQDEALRACGRAANSTLPLVGALAGNATSSALVCAGVLAPEVVLPVAGICALGGAIGSLGGYALQRICERGVSEEAKTRDATFCEAQNKTPLEVTTDVLVGAGAAALSNGLAKGIRRAVVPKYKVGETALTYTAKKKLTEGCIKTGVTEIPKALRKQDDSGDQAEEVGLQLVANIGFGGLSSAAGETTKKLVLKHIDPANPRAKVAYKIGAATAKSTASASVRATQGIVASTVKGNQINLVEPALDIIAESSAGVVNAIVGNATDNDFFKANPLLKNPVEKLSVATAQQVKKVVKGKNRKDLAATLQDTLEDTVVRLADINEKIEIFGKETAKQQLEACKTAARCAQGEQPEDTTEIVEPANDLDISGQLDDPEEIGEIVLGHDESGFAELTTQTGRSWNPLRADHAEGLEVFQECECHCDNSGLTDAEPPLEITEEQETLRHSVGSCSSLVENPDVQS